VQETVYQAAFQWWEYVLFGIIILGGVAGLGVFTALRRWKKGPIEMEQRDQTDRGFRGRS
jgi:hypothetical protein